MELRTLRCLPLVVLLAAGCASTPQTPPAPMEPPTAAPQPPVEEPQTPRPEPPPRVLPERLTIAAVGDMMLGTDFPTDRLPADDASILTGATERLRAADIAFGNLEGVLLDGGEPFKVCKNPALCYLFRTPSRYVQHFADAGFDVLSLANNHARDFGEDGRDATMRTLDEAGIAHSGREGDVASWEVSNVRIAMIAFAPNPGSHSINNIPTAQDLVRKLSIDHDLVIVSFHGGAEGVAALHVPFAEEFYYGEARGDLVAFSHAVIDAGADLVLGHGPHVPRGLEIYANRLIAYSLGNFATYSGISVAGIKGVAPLLVVEVSPDGQFLKGEIVSLRQVRPFGPRSDPDKRALTMIRELSESDFGANAPIFTVEGRIFPNTPHAE